MVCFPIYGKGRITVIVLSPSANQRNVGTFFVHFFICSHGGVDKYHEVRLGTEIVGVIYCLIQR